jgi:HlyD family secretion protein
MSRLITVVFVGVAMLGLIIYSQFRQAPQYVSGIIEADEIRLGSRVGGRVAEVFVQEGDLVQSGQPLIRFEPYDLLEREQRALNQLSEKEAFLKKLQAGNRQEEIAQAKARYEKAQAQLSLVLEGPRQQEVAAARSRLEAAQADFKLAQQEFERQSESFQNNASSKSEFDIAEERLNVTRAIAKVRQNELAILDAGARQQEIDISRAEVENLRLAWEIAKQGFRPEEIEQATAARDAAQAGLEAIRRQKTELTITAPGPGAVDSLDLRPGDLVPPNAPVMTILSPKNLWVRAYIPQKLMQLRVGQKLQVTVDSLPAESLDGEVTFISQQAEFTPSNVQTPDERAKQVYRIRVTIRDTQHRLRPGMTANVWLESE